MLPYIRFSRVARENMTTEELLLVLNAHMQYTEWYNVHEGENGYFMGSEEAKWHDTQAAHASSFLYRRGVENGPLGDWWKRANHGDLTELEIAYLADEIGGL